MRITSLMRASSPGVLPIVRCRMYWGKTATVRGLVTKDDGTPAAGVTLTLFRQFADPGHGRAAVLLANRGTYSGWILEPGAWPDLCAAIVGP